MYRKAMLEKLLQKGRLHKGVWLVVAHARYPWGCYKPGESSTSCVNGSILRESRPLNNSRKSYLILRPKAPADQNVFLKPTKQKAGTMYPPTSEQGMVVIRYFWVFRVHPLRLQGSGETLDRPQAPEAQFSPVT